MKNIKRKSKIVCVIALLIVVSVAVSAVLAVVISDLALNERITNKIVGTYEVEGSDDWTIFYRDGTTTALKDDVLWSGTWRIIDEKSIYYSVDKGPKNLILNITETGLQWRDDRTYTKIE